MINIFDQKSVINLYCDSFEEGCIKKAVNDLTKDMERVGNKSPEVMQYLPTDFQQGIYIGSLENERFSRFLDNVSLDYSSISGKGEHFLIKSLESDQGIVICGNDKRGTMYGIYTFCEKFLGVDPLYYWTDHAPEKKAKLNLEGIDIIEGPQTYKIRGWFMNDEDLFTGWEGGKVKQHENYPMLRHHPIHFDKVLETALRMKQNLIIPSTYLNIDNPDEEDIVRLISERGLFVSQHHQEPMGVSADIFESFWNKRGESLVATYMVHPEKYEEVWTYYAKKYAKYPDVIWQLGLRGKDDRPVWHGNDKVPQTMEGRGRLISDAIAKQYEIIQQVLGHNNFLSTSTLWMEGMMLHNNGVLEFPNDTIIINADFGPTQMWGEGYESVKRKPGTSYGVYYHVAYWSCGPHLVQGTSPEKIYYNYSRAIGKGDTAYSILNVTNIREMVFNINCVKEITWNFKEFDVQDYRQSWVDNQFGLKDTEELSNVIKDFYSAYNELENEVIPGQMILLDGMCIKVGKKLFEIIQGMGLKPEKLQNQRLYQFSSQEDFVAYFKTASMTSIDKFERVYIKLIEIYDQISEERKSFYMNNLIVQCEIILGLYKWVHSLCYAAEVKLSCGQEEVFEKYKQEALYHINKILLDRKKAESGEWKNWYSNDKLLDILKYIGYTAELH